MTNDCKPSIHMHIKEFIDYASNIDEVISVAVENHTFVIELEISYSADLFRHQCPFDISDCIIQSIDDSIQSEKVKENLAYLEKMELIDEQPDYNSALEDANLNLSLTQDEINEYIN